MNEIKSKETPCFDIDRPIAVKTISPDGIKKIEVRFPTDDEWIARSRRHKSVYKTVGRGSQEIVPPEPNEADAELLERIRIGDGPEVDVYEAYRILEELSRAEVVDDPCYEAGGFRIALRVPGALTTHSFRMPTAKERFRLQRLATPKLVNNRTEVWSVNYDLARDLYEAMCRETTGYAGAVPIVHKLAALMALNAELARTLEGDEPENF